jgi:hypothetical protein
MDKGFQQIIRRNKTHESSIVKDFEEAMEKSKQILIEIVKVKITL